MSETTQALTNAMPLAEVLQAKKELASAIRELVLEFSNRTGLMVDGLELQHMQDWGGKHIMYFVEVEVQL